MDQKNPTPSVLGDLEYEEKEEEDDDEDDDDDEKAGSRYMGPALPLWSVTLPGAFLNHADIRHSQRRPHKTLWCCDSGNGQRRTFSSGQFCSGSGGMSEKNL